MSDLGLVLRERCTQEAVDAWVAQERRHLDLENDVDLPSRRHYVYILIHGHRPFYVGLGFGPRWKEHWRVVDTNRHKQAIIRQLVAAGIPKERCVLIAQRNLTRAQAGVLETALVAAIGRFPLGPLTNLSDGGEASSFGYRWTPEQKANYPAGMWITNGVLSRKITPSDAIPEGWHEGRTFADDHLEAIRASGFLTPTPETIAKAQAARQIVRDNTPTRIWITDGARNRQVEPDTVIPEGWWTAHTLSAEGRASTAAAAKLQFTSEEASRRIRLGWADPESRAALIASRQNQIWFTNGVENRRQDASIPIPDGWERGKTVVRETPKRWISKGAENRQLTVGEPLPDGWQEGRPKGMMKPSQWITDGTSGQRLPLGEPVPDGWWIGFPPRAKAKSSGPTPAGEATEVAHDQSTSQPAFGF